MKYSELEKTTIDYVEAATRAAYANVPIGQDHQIDHSERVAINTSMICSGDNIPLFKPIIAAWLHDYGRPGEYLAKQQGIKLPHAEESARQVPTILRPFRETLGDDVIYEIQTAVAIHGKLNSPDDSLTARILKDADRLDGLGSAGLFRTITAKYGSPLCNRSNPFPDKRISRDNVTAQEITLVESILYTIEWFTMLRMPTAIRIGLFRVQKQIGFLEGLMEELDLSSDLLERNEMIQQARGIMQQIPNTPSYYVLV